MNEMEQIGKVRIEDSSYSGRESYMQEELDHTLLEIVQKYQETDYDAVIKEKNNWEILYQLSSNRANIIEWFENEKDQTVLEIGSECGAITGKLSEKFAGVTCIERSKRKSLVNAYRNQNRDNIEIYVGTYQEVEKQLTKKYDVITLIGVLGQAELYTDGENPKEELLCSLKSHLKPGGRILIAIENKFGLKYWAGCAEEHKGTIYAGIEGYLGEKNEPSLTKKGLEKLIAKCGYQTEAFYYPYPDYRLPTTIYSDAYLPKIGELNNNYNQFDRDRIETFDEAKVFDTVIEEEEFPMYANSFLAVIREER